MFSIKSIRCPANHAGYRIHIASALNGTYDGVHRQHSFGHSHPKEKVSIYKKK